MRINAVLTVLLPLLLSLAPWSAGQDSNRIVAVGDFENYSGDLRFGFMQKGVADAVINRLTGLEGLMVVERQKFAQVMAELQLGQSGLMNDMTVRRVGRSLSAGLMIVGGFEYNSLAGQIRINARVVEIETGLIVYSDTVIDDERLADDLQGAIAEKMKAWFMFKFGLHPAPMPAQTASTQASVSNRALPVESALTQTSATQADTGSAETVPNPARFIDLIRLMFTETRPFPPPAKAEKAAEFKDLIRTIEKP